MSHLSCCSAAWILQNIIGSIVCLIANYNSLADSCMCWFHVFSLDYSCFWCCSSISIKCVCSRLFAFSCMQESSVHFKNGRCRWQQVLNKEEKKILKMDHLWSCCEQEASLAQSQEKKWQEPGQSWRPFLQAHAVCMLQWTCHSICAAEYIYTTTSKQSHIYSHTAMAVIYVTRCQ